MEELGFSRMEDRAVDGSVERRVETIEILIRSSRERSHELRDKIEMEDQFRITLFHDLCELRSGEAQPQD